jgi:hypothetical protein
VPCDAVDERDVGRCFTGRGLARAARRTGLRTALGDDEVIEQELARSV